MKLQRRTVGSIHTMYLHAMLSMAQLGIPGCDGSYYQAIHSSLTTPATFGEVLLTQFWVALMKGLAKCKAVDLGGHTRSALMA